MIRVSKRQFITAAGSLTAATAAAPSALSRAAEPPVGPSPRDAAREIIRDARRIIPPEGIESLRLVEIGGVKQWISVRGRDRRNPILLFIHGGPGSTEMPVSWLYQSAWEDFFTVVQWDQRASGKTVSANDQAAMLETLSIERACADGEELVGWLRKEYGKQKIFVLGHSWGTVIGMNLARRRPKWLHAYLGMGQIIHMREGERIGYEFALREARADRNETAIKALEALAPYPAADGTVSFDQIITQRTWVIHYGGLTMGRGDFNYDLNARKISPEYTDAELRASSNNGVNLQRLLPDMMKLDFRSTMNIDCPVFIFAGRRDYQTPSQVAATWLERVKAPKKAVFWFERSAHMMHLEQPGKFLLHLVQDVRPLAVRVGDAAPEDQPGIG